MHVANIHEAKTHLSRLLQRATEGEEIWIAKSGEPIVKLVPVEVRKEPRKPGLLKGEMWVADDFDETPQEIIDAFENSEIFP